METNNQLENVYKVVDDKDASWQDCADQLVKVSRLEAMQPLNVEILTVKAYLLRLLGYYESSLYYYFNVIPKHFCMNKKALQEHVAYCLYESGNYERMIAYAGEKQDESMLCLKAFALRNIGRYEESLCVCNDAIRRYGNVVWALFQRGWSLRKLGRIEDAFEDFMLVEEAAQTGDLLAMYYLPFCLCYLGQTDEALASLIKNEENTHCQLLQKAEIFSLVGDVDGAERTIMNMIRKKSLTVKREILYDPALETLFCARPRVLKRLTSLFDQLDQQDLLEKQRAETLHGRKTYHKSMVFDMATGRNGVCKTIYLTVGGSSMVPFCLGGERTIINSCFMLYSHRKADKVINTQRYGELTGYDELIDIELDGVRIEAVPAFVVTAMMSENVLGWDVLSKFNKMRVCDDVLKLC